MSERGGGALRAEETRAPRGGGGWVVVLLSLAASLCFDSFAEELSVCGEKERGKGKQLYFNTSGGGGGDTTHSGCKGISPSTQVASDLAFVCPPTPLNRPSKSHTASLS